MPGDSRNEVSYKTHPRTGVSATCTCYGQYWQRRPAGPRGGSRWM